MHSAMRLTLAAALLTAPLISSAKQIDFGEVLALYRQSQIGIPVNYKATGTQQLPGVEKRSFALESQNWSPLEMVEPRSWQHDVAIYIPENALPGQALLVANNGTPYPIHGKVAQGPTDFTEEMALSIATKTRTIVISASNVPNQYLTYSDDGIPRREDSSAAHSWKLFLENPATRTQLPLHIPMMQVMVRTMHLAQRELAPWQVRSYIASGVSKRGWASWLAALTDERITAIVPFVIDILNTDEVLEHTYRVYGKNWPLAFADYHREGITGQRKTENFTKLRQIVDPLTYLDSAYAERLAIPKYLINASGDDFFVPDNSRFYLDKLPGSSTLRVAPNSDHAGIRAHIEEALIPFINRLRQTRAMPTVEVSDEGPHRRTVQFSEKPTKVVQWTALNPEARDFRKACAIAYEALPLASDQRVTITLQSPERGWMARFVEATFADGLVVTTPVYILPQTYPTQAPPALEPGCKTFPEARSSRPIAG